MAAQREIAVSLSLTGEPSSIGKATLIDRAIPYRVGRAVQALLLVWVIAGVCVFLPIAHFVLVPLFGVAGVAIALVRFFDDTSLVSAEGICPRCKVERVFEGAGRYRPGRAVHCNGCGSQIAVNAR